MNAPLAPDHLATATALLLQPAGLDLSDLGRVLGDVAVHRADYADLYLQYTRSEGWSLEEGLVKSGSFSIDAGAGVRVVEGERTAFAYTDDLSLEALQQAARTTRSIAAAGGDGRAPVPARGPGRSLYAPVDPVASLDADAKVAMLLQVERMARAADPRISQVMASLAAEYDVVLLLRADGRVSADVRPLVRLSLQVIAEADGRRQQG
ncbi:MAG: PmbA/TldA family metallopeptidase, partial [Burkholderiales bacterium]